MQACMCMCIRICVTDIVRAPLIYIIITGFVSTLRYIRTYTGFTAHTSTYIIFSHVYSHQLQQIIHIMYNLTCKFNCLNLQKKKTILHSIKCRK